MNWFRRRDSDLQDKIRTHLDLETEENKQRVWVRRKRLAAERKFGSISSVRKRVRQGRPLYWIETAWQDARYGVRSPFRTTLLAAAVILTLTLGIGLTTAVNTLINAIAFRARIDKDPAAYVRVWPDHLVGCP